MANLDPDAEKVIDELFANVLGHFVIYDLIYNETIEDLMSCSGSTGYGLDTYEIYEAWFIEPEIINFSTNIYLDGTPNDETSILGTSILVSIQGQACKEDDNWKISDDYKVIEADFYPHNDNDYDEYYSSVMLSNTSFYETFLESLEKIEALLYAEVNSTVDIRQYILRLLYINLITTLETFLSDAFINTVLADHVLVRKFVESNPEFAKQKFSLQEIFSTVDEIGDKVKQYLSSQIWHNLEKVKPMYKDTLSIDFPEDLEKIFRSVKIRHDLVHRNGKSTSGEEIKITQEIVEELLINVRKFIDDIDRQLGNKSVDNVQ